jgi:Flp pilus assembly pilin Flp
MFGKLLKFKREEDGAVTVDWVVLTAAIVLIGISAVLLVNGGVADLSRTTKSALADTTVGATEQAGNGSADLGSSAGSDNNVADAGIGTGIDNNEADAGTSAGTDSNATDSASEGPLNGASGLRINRGAARVGGDGASRR